MGSQANRTGTTISAYGLSPRALLPFFRGAPADVDKAVMQRRGTFDPKLGRIVMEKPPTLVAPADHDQDGIVSKSEFSQWHWRQKGRGPSAKEWGEFSSSDVNGDGKIQREEFIVYLKTYQGQRYVRAEEKALEDRADGTTVEDSIDAFIDTFNIINASPRDKYKKPLTSAQAVGWTPPSRLEKPKCSPRGYRPIRMCKETQYANAYSKGTGLSVKNIWTYDRCGANVRNEDR